MLQRALLPFAALVVLVCAIASGALAVHDQGSVGALNPSHDATDASSGFIFETAASPSSSLSSSSLVAEPGVFATYLPTGVETFDRPPVASRAILEQLLAHPELALTESELVETMAMGTNVPAGTTPTTPAAAGGATSASNATQGIASPAQPKVRPQTTIEQITSAPDEAEDLVSGAFNLDIKYNGGNLTRAPLLRNGLDLPLPFTACDMHYSHNLHLGGFNMANPDTKGHVIAPLQFEDGVAAVYSFDELARGQVLDRTGNQHHGIIYDALTGAPSSLAVGPGRLTLGASATFNGKNVLAVGDVFDVAPNDPVQASGFTISAWFYLTSDRVEIKSPAKGAHVFGTGQFSVGLLSSRNLVVHSAKHTFVSHAQVRPHVWTHIALVYDSHNFQSLSLFVNGVRDVRGRRMGAGDPSQKTVYVGQYPSSHIRYSPYDTLYYLDDLKISIRPVSQAELGAEAFPALGAVESSYATLGCGRHSACTREQAIHACSEGYHLCSRRELDAGALFVARVQGWISWTDEVWAAPEPASGSSAASKAATSFLELESDVNPSEATESETEALYVPSHSPEYRLSPAVPLDQISDSLNEEPSLQSELSDLEEAVPSVNPYSLLDAQDQGLNVDMAKPSRQKKQAAKKQSATKKASSKPKANKPEAKPTPAKKDQKNKKAAGKSKATPMPPPATPIEVIRRKKFGPDTKTTTKERKSTRRILPLPPAVGEPHAYANAASNEWATKVAICCAHN